VGQIPDRDRDDADHYADSMAAMFDGRMVKRDSEIGIGKITFAPIEDVEEGELEMGVGMGGGRRGSHKKGNSSVNMKNLSKLDTKRPLGSPYPPSLSMQHQQEQNLQKLQRQQQQQRQQRQQKRETPTERLPSRFQALMALMASFFKTQKHDDQADMCNSIQVSFCHWLPFYFYFFRKVY
jgi:hypothetical protein